MKFNPPLLEGVLIKRYKRFLADIRLRNGQEITAHCPNPGAMIDIATPGLRVWVTAHSLTSERKLKYTWEIAEHNNVMVGVNTGRPNNLVEEALLEKKIPELTCYQNWRREINYGFNSRIDFFFNEPGLPLCYLEVKNVHLKREGYAQFPDCVTLRGTKHLKELSMMKNQGARAIILYIVQREDCDRFKTAFEIDPLYATTARDISQQGIETLCYNCYVSPQEINLNKPMTVEL